MTQRSKFRCARARKPSPGYDPPGLQSIVPGSNRGRLKVDAQGKETQQDAYPRYPDLRASIGLSAATRRKEGGESHGSSDSEGLPACDRRRVSGKRHRVVRLLYLREPGCGFVGQVL